jgi:hypothetical protein
MDRWKGMDIKDCKGKKRKHHHIMNPIPAIAEQETPTTQPLKKRERPDLLT